MRPHTDEFDGIELRQAYTTNPSHVAMLAAIMSSLIRNWYLCHHFEL